MKTIKRMYEHLNWANQRILGHLQNSKLIDNQQTMGLFSHVLFAEQVWLSRLQGKDSSQLPIWAEVDIEVCEKLVQQNEQNFSAYFSMITDNDLENMVTYTNSKGKEFKTSLRDILTHVALHGQYHRGQINTRLRLDGFEPINVDFITFVR